MLLSHFECLGLRVNFAKIALSSSQLILFLRTVINCVTALCDGKPFFGPWSEKEGYLHINCLEILASMVRLSHLYVRPEGTTRLSPFGQYDGGVLLKSPGRSFIEVPLYPSRAPLEVGSAQLALAKSSARAEQTEPGSRHAISEQCPLRRVDTPPTNGSGNQVNQGT